MAGLPRHATSLSTFPPLKQLLARPIQGLEFEYSSKAVRHDHWTNFSGDLFSPTKSFKSDPACFFSLIDRYGSRCGDGEGVRDVRAADLAPRAILSSNSCCSAGTEPQRVADYTHTPQRKTMGFGYHVCGAKRRVIAERRECYERLGNGC